MVKKLVILLVVFFLALLASGCTLRQRKMIHVTGMMLGEASIYCDYRMTKFASHGGKWDIGFKEQNPVLGPTPSVNTLKFWGATTMLATALIYWLPDSPVWDFLKTTFYVTMPTLEIANDLTLPMLPGESMCEMK